MQAISVAHRDVMERHCPLGWNCFRFGCLHDGLRAFDRTSVTRAAHNLHLLSHHLGDDFARLCDFLGDAHRLLTRVRGQEMDLSDFSGSSRGNDLQKPGQGRCLIFIQVKLTCISPKKCSS